MKETQARKHLKNIIPPNTPELGVGKPRLFACEFPLPHFGLCDLGQAS